MEELQLGRVMGTEKQKGTSSKPSDTTYPWSNNTSTGSGTWTVGKSKTTVTDASKYTSLTYPGYNNKPQTLFSYDNSSGVFTTIEGGANQTQLMLIPSGVDNKIYKLDPKGNIPTLSQFVSQWVQSNNGKDSMLAMKQKLIAKNYLSGAAAKEALSAGNSSTIAFETALAQAANQVSFNNKNAYDAKLPLASFEDAISYITPATTQGSGSGSGGRRVQLQYENFNKDDYRVEVDKAYRDFTGQAADEETLNKFIGTMNALAKKNPVKTVTTTKGNTTTQKTTGGVQNQLENELRKQMLEDPNTEGYQKATTLMDSFIKALQAPVQLG